LATWSWLLQLLLMISSATPEAADRLRYPRSRATEHFDEYHGRRVEDPYRWLEDLDSDETRAWVAEQQSVTERYLSAIPERNELRSRLAELLNFERITSPRRLGKNIVYFKNDGLQDQAVVYVQRDSGETEVLLDPNALSVDGTSALGYYSFSRDERYMAYTISHSGSDWSEIYVIDLVTGKQLPDKVQWAKYTRPRWWKNGYFYLRYDEPSDKLATVSENQKVYYHKLGTSQQEDALIHEDAEHPQRLFDIISTDSERYLVLYITEAGKIGERVFIRDTTKSDTSWQPFYDKHGDTVQVTDEIDGKLLIMTDIDAPTYRLALADPTATNPADWTTIVAATDHSIREAGYIGGKIIVIRQVDAVDTVEFYTPDGTMTGHLQLPGIGTVSGFEGFAWDPKIYYSFSSFTHPPTIYECDIASQTSTVFHKPSVPFDVDRFVTTHMLLTSKDGTQVPMFVTHLRGLNLDGSNPTELTGYGGFNLTITPAFSSTVVAFVERGGVFAMAALRGGGEYGRGWHDAGRRFKKQNVFDDFIAAAEHLISAGYTSPKKLGIYGRSNGGLLVGAVMTQRPDLFRVALPTVGVLDMLRFHKFTIGWGWVAEYGSSDDPQDFDNLFGYSPLHNLKSDIEYPATLIMTADHDDRVVPAHSFKFAARLQEVYRGNRPMLIWIDSKAGHGAGKPLSKVINEYADKYAFLLHNTRG
jgi:prolyl oligopeptidase